MAQTSMLHVRVDDALKSNATERLAGVGLTVSDAVRMLLTKIAADGLPPSLVMNDEDHDEWFRAKVYEALNSSKPTVSHSTVMNKAQKIIDDARSE